MVLASDAIDELLAAGHVIGATKVDIARSGIAVAVRAGAPHPAIDYEDALRESVRSAPSIGCSTGPSGVQLAKLFERWGIAAEILNASCRPGPACRSAH